jgi:predicted SnoaL-like aldol condensation-catalyzing enzyme
MAPTATPTVPSTGADRTSADRATAERNARNARNKQFVIDHFEEFVNRQNVDVVYRNMTSDFYDHDGADGKPADRDGARAMMAGLLQRVPDLKVRVIAAVAEGDFVMVRNQWTGTNAQTGRRVEFHGFVQWRFEGGKLAERWATVTAPHEATGDVQW